MSNPWAVIIALAAGTALIKAGGAALGAGRRMPVQLASVAAFLPAALLAALLVTETFVRANHGIGVDARAAGLAGSGITVLFKAPMPVVIVTAVVTTTLVSALL